MRIGIVRSVMVAICAPAFPTEYSLSASDPLTSSTQHRLKSANKRTPASHQLQPHSPTTSTKWHCTTFPAPKKLSKMPKLTSRQRSSLPYFLISKVAAEPKSQSKPSCNYLHWEATYIQLNNAAMLKLYQGFPNPFPPIEHLQQHPSFCLWESRNLPP